MATYLNRPDKLTVDSFSDPNLDRMSGNAYFSQFTNQLNTPLLDVKGIQLLRANFVNPSLQLNDFNGQLIFVYSRSATATVSTDSTSFKAIRLHPSWYVPAAGYTTFTKNKYYNNGTELVAALNAAAGTSGDLATYNPGWVANDVTFSFDTATRRISFTGNTATNYYAPVPADHPAMATFLASITLNSFSGIVKQPTYPNITMNSRLGFALAYQNRGIFWTGASVVGCATSTGVPQLNAVATEADSFPIMTGTQNINVYCSVINGSGNDSGKARNLLATLPVENVSLGVNSYTLTSVEKPAKSVANEVYTLVFNFTDDHGAPFFFYNNMNINLELNIYY